MVSATSTEQKVTKLVKESKYLLMRSGGIYFARFIAAAVTKRLGIYLRGTDRLVEIGNPV